MKKERTVEETLKYYSEVIKNGQELKLSKQDRKSPLYLSLKRIYSLGDGDIKKGMQRSLELEKKRHDQHKRDVPLFAKIEKDLSSNDTLERAMAEFILKATSHLPTEEADKLAKEAFYEAIEKPKQNKRKSKFQSRSIKGMLEFIAYREDMRQRGKVIAWTLNPFGDSGRIDIDTADKIAHHYGEEIKSRWDDPKYNAMPFVEKMLADYPSLTSKWDELKPQDNL